MNINVCNIYNADFDGDAMNIHYAPNECSQYELKHLNKIENMIINKQNNQIIIKFQEESIAGCMLLSLQKNIDMPHYKYYISKLNSNMQKELLDMYNPNITGWDIISYFLPNNLNYEYKTSYYNEQIKELLHTKQELYESHKKVKIVNGKVLCGIFDKSFNNVLNQVRYMGQDVIISLIENLQKISISVMTCNNITAGIKELFQSNQNEIVQKYNEVISKCDKID